LRDPVICEALDLFGPLDVQSTLRVARDLERVRKERQREVRILRNLRAALSHPGVLDRLRARRTEPWTRDLLVLAYRLGLTDVVAWITTPLVRLRIIAPPA
jgi:hypothetical protein